MALTILKTILALSTAASPAASAAFLAPNNQVAKFQGTHQAVRNPPNGDALTDNSRRSFLRDLTAIVASGSSAAVVSSIPGVANAEAESMERGGVKLTPFNSLAFNYRGGSSPTQGTINEPSISYSDFLSKLNSDEVTFVEFLAPNGDVAYATLKQSAEGESGSGSGSGSGGKIRIGEGFPLEDPEGWSSPAFVIKAVAKKGVPYKFVVPGINASL